MQRWMDVLVLAWIARCKVRRATPQRRAAAAMVQVSTMHRSSASRQHPERGQHVPEHEEHDRHEQGHAMVQALHKGL